jgi:Fe-S-cluster-containing dehydrogenase component/CRP-like cAMP-binding protein
VDAGPPSAGATLEDSVFSGSLLRALDARGRADVSLATRRHELAPGAALFVAGAPADALFVVARGKLRLGGDVDPKTASPGDVFGWDAAVPGAVRSGGANATEASAVVELPLGALRRGLTRSGAEALLAREERRARRRSFRALLRATELGSALAEWELDRLLDESREETLAAGDALGAPDRPAAAWLVVSGVVALARGARGYAGRGQLVGLEPALEGRAETEATALGDVLALAVPAPLLAALHRGRPEVTARALALSRERRERQARAAAALGPERTAAGSYGRLESAASLLAIEVGSCVDCGHCVRACADTHGVPRFSREGERVQVSVDAGGELRERAYLLPNACQHCKEPACLPACPTSALARDARGAVEIREELCTGCSACVSACPWDAVKLVPRGAGAVAVKCDLCSGRDGPECVLACPTGALARVEPARDFAELRVVLGAKHRPVSRPRSLVGPWLARAAVLPPVAVALALAEHAGAQARFVAGVVGGVLALVLAAHALVKRVPAARSAVGRLLRRAFGNGASLAPLVGAHATLGVLSLAAILVHSGARLGAGVAGVLSLSYWLVIATGALGGVAYLVVPRRLARLEPGRERTPDAAELERRLFAALSGGNDAVRALSKGFLVPHATSALGALRLLVSRRSADDDRRALVARVEAALGGRTSARLAGLDALARAAVAVRAGRAARLGRALLGAFVPVHLVLAVLLVVLLVGHVAVVLR